MREVFAVIIFIAVLIMFLVSRHNSDTHKQVEEPIATCGVNDSTNKKPPTLFMAKCMTCHHREKNGTGPALIGIDERQPYLQWFAEFVTNQDSLIRIKESYTDTIMNWSEEDYRHNFKELDKDELDALLRYCRK